MSTGELADRLNPWFGPVFGSIVDISTIVVLCLTGASVTIGLRLLVPDYLHRFGMQLDWAHRLDYSSSVQHHQPGCHAHFSRQRAGTARDLRHQCAGHFDQRRSGGLVGSAPPSRIPARPFADVFSPC